MRGKYVFKKFTRKTVLYFLSSAFSPVREGRVRGAELFLLETNAFSLIVGALLNLIRALTCLTNSFKIWVLSTYELVKLISSQVQVAAILNKNFKK